MSKIEFSFDGDVHFTFNNGYGISIHSATTIEGDQAQTALVVLSIPLSCCTVKSTPTYKGESFDEHGYLFLGPLKANKIAKAIRWASTQPLP